MSVDADLVNNKNLKIQACFLLVVALFLFFPLINDYFEFIEEKPPHGTAAAKPALNLNKKTFISRSWQRRLEARAKKESGYWTPLMKVGNEIYRSFFMQISPFHNKSVLMGRQGHLFQTAHLAAFNRNKKVKVERIRKRYQEFKELQDILAQHGKTMVLLISPNVISLYPEIVPDIYIDPARLERPSNYIEALPILNELGINYVDAFELLNRIKSDFDFKLFARSASHWNSVASCLALQAVNNKLKELGSKYFREFTCDKFEIAPRAGAPDRDLVDIANVVWPDRFSDPTPYVRPSFLQEQPTSTPSVLLVGTSYLFAIQKQVYEWGLSSDLLFYFYFSRWRQNKERSFRALDRSKINWQAVLSRDVIVINVGMGNPIVPGYGFIEKALSYLKQEKK